jgi:5-methylthioribose kinase
MAAEAKIEMTITMRLDEEQLRDIFDTFDIKFSKKKVKELQEELNQDFEQAYQAEFEEMFEEIVGNWLNDSFGE